MMNLLYFYLITLMISLMLMMFNIFTSKKKMNDREKSSPFECGFDPFSSPRLPFSMQFYMISIIFLIFDIELIIFLPMIPSFLLNKWTSWMETIIIFIMILTIGLYIEWKDGALKWLK